MFLVTGVGCSGTKWMAQFFTNAGFPCGHEQWFKCPNPEVMKTSESSWIAAPYVPVLIDDIKIIKVVRNPLNVVKSAFATGFLHDKSILPHKEFIKKTRPDIDVTCENHLERVVNWVSMWDKSIDMWRAVFTYRIENYKVTVLRNLVQYATGQSLTTTQLRAAYDSVPQKINTHRPNNECNDITWEQILMYKNGGRLMKRAIELGYDIEQ